MLLNCGVGEDSWESLGLQGDPTSPFWKRSTLGFLWREWSWSGSSNTLATGCKDQTHLKRPWCWEILVNMNLSKLWEIVKDREAWHVAVYGVARSWTWLSDWTAFDVGALDWLSQHRTYSPNRDTLRVRQSSVKRYSRTIVLACLGHPVCREPPLWTLVCPWLAIKFF